jgi:GT2 family glycosyltransferase
MVALSTDSVAVMITTRNRLDDFKRTCEQVLALRPLPHELLITCDGCDDGTVEYARRHLPQARLFVNAVGQGSVHSRDQMLRSATSDLVLSLDDDSYPEQADCVTMLINLFRLRPGLAVAHFPQRSDEYPSSLTVRDFGPSRHSGSFANSGACYRRSIYVSLPGFYTGFFHAYEEPDYALQCIASEYEVLYFTGITIRHHWSAIGRNEMRVHHQHARNELWSVLIRCPAALTGPVLMYRLVRQARYAASRGWSWVIREPVWWGQALSGAFQALSNRDPVSYRAYMNWLRLLRHL